MLGRVAATPRLRRRRAATPPRRGRSVESARLRYADAAGPVVDALLEDELLGTAASRGGRGRFERRATAFETLQALATRLADINELTPLLESLGRRATVEDGTARIGAARRDASRGSRGATEREAKPATCGVDGITLGSRPRRNRWTAATTDHRRTCRRGDD